MNATRLTALALTSLLALGAAAPAMADDHGRGHGNGHGNGHRDDRRDDRHDYRERREAYRDGYHDGRRDDRRYDRRPVVVYRPEPRPYYRPAPRPRYYGWAPGHRYRDYYSGPIYVVNDYDRYHVRRPPHGYHWVRDDTGNLLMVAIASGIIADLVLHH
ncbi:MAG TPA: RcnB family protein [Stenotrophomonas sp.]|nr:RcnB family protein [Stenotrophomonas sp.]